METFKDIPGFQGYEITSEGTVRNKKSGYILKRKNHWKGYHIVDIKGKHNRLHRLVMLAFVGPSELQVNHKNGIKTDNRFENLEYVSCSENRIHAIETGLCGKKVKTVLQYDFEGRKVGEFKSHREASRALGFDQSNISKCVRGEYKTYKGFIWKTKE